MRGTFVSLVFAAVLAPSAFAGGRNPGSLLVYPVHRSGGSASFFTVVNVTNTNLMPATRVSLGGTTNVHFQYVNVIEDKYNPFCPKGCTIFDRVEVLTPADTMSVLASCHNATFGSQEGYLVVAAEDPTKYRTPWSHNWLLGSAYILSGSGVAYSIEAVPFTTPVAAGDETDLNKNRRHDFDDAEYESIPDVLYIDSFVALAGSQLSLINFTGGPEDINTVLFSVWNDYEYPLSATLEFKCWFDQKLTMISELFSEDFLRRTPNDPYELDINCDNKGDLETGWALIQSIRVRTPGGNPVAADGAMLGAITCGPTTAIDGGRLLSESVAKQKNGSFQF